MLTPVWTLLGSGVSAATGGNNIAASITRNQDPGTILVVAVRLNSVSSAFTISDSRGGNTYQQDIFNNSSNSQGVYSCNPVNLLQNGDTVTAAFSVNGTKTILVYQVTNLNLASWYQASAFNSGTSTACDSGTASLPSGNYELFGAGTIGNGMTYTAGSNGQSGTYGILDQLEATSVSRFCTEHMNVSPASTLAYKAAGTSSASVSWKQIFVAYKIAPPVTQSLTVNYNVATLNPVWTLLGKAALVSATTLVATLTRAQDPNTHLVVLARNNQDGAITSFTDSKAHSYQRDSYQQVGNTFGAYSCRSSNLLQVGDTVSAVFSVSGTSLMLVYQVTSLSPTAWFKDTSYGSAGSGTALDSGSKSFPAGQYELLGVGSIGAGLTMSGGTNGQSGTYTVMDSVAAASGTFMTSEHIPVFPTSTLSYKAAATSSSSTLWSMSLVAYNISFTTSVSKSQAVNYGIVGTVSKALPLSFKSISTISKSVTLNYTVRQQVAKTIAPTYTVVQQISKTRSLNYNIRVRTAVSSLVLSYLVRKAIVRTASPTYLIKRTISKTAAFNFALRGGISKTLPVTYRVRAFLAKTCTVNYRINVQLVKSLAMAYKVNRRVAVTSFAVSYNVRPPAVHIALPVNYVIFGPIKITAQTVYFVQRTVAKSLPVAYQVHLKAVKTVAVNYNVRNTISKQFAVSYRVRRTISKQYVVSYRLIATISKSRGFNYTVHKAVAQSLTPSYILQQRVAASLVPAYKVRRQVSKPLTALYGVRTRVSRSVAVSYRLRVVLAKPPRFTYNVRQQVRASVGITFRLRLVRARPLNLTYKLQAQIRRSATISYGVSGHLSVYLALAYRIREDVLIPGDDPIAAKFQATLLSAKISNWAS